MLHLKGHLRASCCREESRQNNVAVRNILKIWSWRRREEWKLLWVILLYRPYWPSGHSEIGKSWNPKRPPQTTFYCRQYSLSLAVISFKLSCPKVVEEFNRPWHIPSKISSMLIIFACSLTKSLSLAKWLSKRKKFVVLNIKDHRTFPICVNRQYQMFVLRISIKWLWNLPGFPSSGCSIWASQSILRFKFEGPKYLSFRSTFPNSLANRWTIACQWVLRHLNATKYMVGALVSRSRHRTAVFKPGYNHGCLWLSKKVSTMGLPKAWVLELRSPFKKRYTFALCT